MDIQIGHFYLTKSGVYLQAEAQTGYPLTFTRCGVSEQLINSLDELKRLEKLTNEKGNFFGFKRNEIFYQLFPMPHSKFVVLERFDMKINIR